MPTSNGGDKPVLLKISGEALGPRNAIGPPIDLEKLSLFASEILAAAQKQIKICIVVGGGNLWRGAGVDQMDRSMADTIGMYATVLNGLALKGTMIHQGWPEDNIRVMSDIPAEQGCEQWIWQRAKHHLVKGRLVICTGGIGQSHFTTDTAAVQRALDIGATIVLKGTDVAGVYDADPKTDPSAVLYPTITFEAALSKGLMVMDQTAFTHAQENNLSIRVFDATVPGNIEAALMGKGLGTLVHN